jgi:putative chitinase
VDDPNLANDPAIAARLLASFLNHARSTIRQALATSPIDYETARRAVNGGLHGLEDFQVAFETGNQLLLNDAFSAAA